jgi:hypothetical protein
MRFVKAHTARGDRLGVVRTDGQVAVAEHVGRLEPSFGDDGEGCYDWGRANSPRP